MVLLCYGQISLSVQSIEYITQEHILVMCNSAENFIGTGLILYGYVQIFSYISKMRLWPLPTYKPF